MKRSKSRTSAKRQSRQAAPPASLDRSASTASARAPLNLAPWFWAGALVLLVALVYWPTIHNGFVWDDDDYVEDNIALRSPVGLRNIWFKLGTTPQYYPLVHSTYWIEYRLWGLNARGYHVVNAVLHAASVLLAWRLLVRLSVPGAWLAAALFAVHPVEVESVAWVTERKNVLSCALALGSILAYLRFSPPEALADRAATAVGRDKWIYYALALALYAAALLSKTVTATVPAVLLVIYWWKQGRFSWREAARLAPFFAIGLGLSAITVWLERTSVGASGEEWNLSVTERVLIAGRALWFYAGKILWPRPLIFFYPRWFIDPRVWWQYLYPAAAVAVMAGLWLARGRSGRGPLAAVLIFAGVLAPALGFFDVFPFRYSFVADHFQYHASIALLALVAATLSLVAARWGPGRQWLARAGAVGLVAVLALVAESRTQVFRDRVTLHEDSLAQNPAAWVAPLNLGYVLYAEGNYAAAIPLLSQAVEIRERLAQEHPEVNYYRDGLTDCLAQLASAQHKGGRSTEAEESLGRAIALREQLVQENPAILDYRNSLAGAYVELGILKRETGRAAAAVDLFNKAIAIREALALEGPARSDFQYDLAWAYVHRGLAQRAVGKVADAAASHRQALAMREELVQAEPKIAKYRTSLAQCLVDLGLIEREQGQGAAAEGFCQRAVDIRRELVREFPDNSDYQDELAGTYAQLALAQQISGKLPEAIKSHTAALEIRQKLVHDQPRNGKYQNDLAASHVDLGFLSADDQAETAFRKAIEIRERLIQEYPAEISYRQSLAATCALLAAAQQRRGRAADAVATRRRLCAIQDQLAADHPTVEAYQIDAAANYVDLALLERDRGQRKEAEEAFRKAIDIRERVIQANPAERTRSHLAGAYVELGIEQRDSGRLEEAVASCQKAIAIYEKLVEDHPSADNEAGLSWAYANLGVAELRRGRAAEALPACRKSVEIRERLVRNQDDLSDYKLNLEAGLAWSYSNLGIALAACQQLDQAEMYLRRAVQVRAKLVQDNPNAVDPQNEIALSCRDLGKIERLLGRTDEAITFYRAAIEIRQQIATEHPTNTANRVQLVNDLLVCADVLASLGQWGQSASLYAQARQLANNSWQAMSPCALAQLAAGDEAAYRSTCAEIVKQFAGQTAGEPNIAAVLALALVVGENPPDISDRALALAQRFASSTPGSNSAATLLGAAQFRAGRDADAIATLTAALSSFDHPQVGQPAPEQGITDRIGRLLGHTILALAYRDPDQSGLRAEQLKLLGPLLDSPPEVSAPEGSSLPAWTAEALRAIARREREGLGAPGPKKP